jgi:hypothetical protein
VNETKAVDFATNFYLNSGNKNGKFIKGKSLVCCTQIEDKMPTKNPRIVIKIRNPKEALDRIKATLRKQGYRGSYQEYNFDSLKPVTILPCGIGVYDKSSFPGIYAYEAVVESSTQPKIVRVDRFQVYRKGRNEYLGPKTVLAFHGTSIDGQWIEGNFPHRRVEDIIQEIENQGVEIDALFVCNPGPRKLPKINGQIPYTYVLGTATGRFDLKEGILYGCLGSRDSTLQIKGRPEHIRITEEDLRPKPIIVN